MIKQSKFNIQNISLAISVSIIAASCSFTKTLPPNETLYTGSTVKIAADSNTTKSERSVLSTELKSLIRPKPNAKFLGLRLKLGLYNLGNDKNFIGKFIRRLGEPPVLTSQVSFEKNRGIMQNRLENRGYFKAQVGFDTVSKHRKTSAVFTATPFVQYKIDSVVYPIDSTSLGLDIDTITKRRKLLRPGDPYDLDIIKGERTRLDTRLKDRGYYYFNPEYFIADVDSTVGGNKVNIYLKTKKNTPQRARERYYINDIYIHADYDVNRDTTISRDSANFYKGYYVIDPQKKFNPRVFERTLVFNPGDLYKRRDHNLSLNRLVNLGVYKFVKVSFDDVDTSDNKLNAYYYLTPLPKRSLRAEISGLQKSNNATGTELSVSYRNRNSFRGAELFTLTGFVGAETQIAGNQARIGTKRFGVDANLYIPRVVGPVKFNTSGEYVPQTRINAGYEFFNRTSQYTLNSFKGSLGYVWKNALTNEHQLNLVQINYVEPLKITEDYKNEIAGNITLARAIERQFILGSMYNYNYNSNARPNRRRNNFYFNGNADASGNVLGLVTGANENNRKYIFNAPFSQYVRGEAEGRYYLRFNRQKETVLATRMIAGVGYAYGNSTTMPFIKQFFIGGTNSIRAFRARSLGPGTYYGGNLATTNNSFLPDQPGDIKLEMNAELRAKLFSIVHGALFVDAGNIWTNKEDPQRPGSKFTGDFLNQFAVGAGFGLRFDITLLVLRADIAIPIRKPYLPNGPDWVFDQIEFKDKIWRRENLVFNLAIGYPF